MGDILQSVSAVVMEGKQKIGKDSPFRLNMITEPKNQVAAMNISKKNIHAVPSIVNGIRSIAAVCQRSGERKTV